MRVLLDTNIILTHLTGREDKYTEEIDKIMESCCSGEIEGYMAFHSLSIIWYVLERHHNASRRELIKNVCEYINVVGCSQEAILEALDNDSFPDFEDNLQEKCAEGVSADYIITANTKDYKESDVKALSPDYYLKLIGR